jgi:glycerol-3-phosphate acyltransferase PlsY
MAIMAGDVAKGVAGAQAGRLIAGDTGAYAAATAAVVGHCFPATSGFRGGKGVATSLGATAAVFPLYAPVDLAVAFLGYWTTKKANIATFAASSVFVLLSFVWWRRKLPNGWGPRPNGGLPLFAAVTSAVIAYKFLTTPAEGSHIEDEAADGYEGEAGAA